MENLTTLLSFSMPLLESLGGGLFVLKNTKLESIEMSSMAGPIPKMIVSENPKLPQCAVYALKDQLLGVQDITSAIAIRAPALQIRASVKHQNIEGLPSGYARTRKGSAVHCRPQRNVAHQSMDAV